MYFDRRDWEVSSGNNVGCVMFFFFGDSSDQPFAVQPAMDAQLLSILSAYLQTEAVKNVVSAMHELEFI